MQKEAWKNPGKHISKEAFSLNGCSFSSGCSSIEQKAGVSYGLSMINSYQLQVMSPVI